MRSSAEVCERLGITLSVLDSGVKSGVVSPQVKGRTRLFTLRDELDLVLKYRPEDGQLRRRLESELSAAGGNGSGPAAKPVSVLDSLSAELTAAVELYRQRVARRQRDEQLAKELTARAVATREAEMKRCARAAADGLSVAPDAAGDALEGEAKRARERVPAMVRLIEDEARIAVGGLADKLGAVALGMQARCEIRRREIVATITPGLQELASLYGGADILEGFGGRGMLNELRALIPAGQGQGLSERLHEIVKGQTAAGSTVEVQFKYVAAVLARLVECEHALTGNATPKSK